MSVFRTKDRPKIDVKDIKESDILPDSSNLPYDNLLSNSGSTRNIYLERASGSKERSVANDPNKQYNTPPWLRQDAGTMGDERRAREGTIEQQEHTGRGSRRQQVRESTGLSRDNGKSEYGGMNIFARVKRKREEEKRFGGHHRKHRRTILASRYTR